MSSVEVLANLSKYSFLTGTHAVPDPDRLDGGRGSTRVVRRSSPDERSLVSVDPKSTAFVLIEYQNDFTSEGGSLLGAVTEVIESTGML
mgnify:CR=1 FL=1